MEIRLYQWASRYMENHTDGLIIALGENEGDARTNARDALEIELRGGRKSEEEKQVARRLFEKDISAEPDVMGKATLVLGSD
jgi:hypothetical protein